MTLSFGITFAAKAGKMVDFPDPAGALTTRSLHAFNLFKNSSRTVHAGRSAGLMKDVSSGDVFTRDTLK